MYICMYMRMHVSYIYTTPITCLSHISTHLCRGSGFCQQCPTSMHTPPGSTRVSDCMCIADFYLAAESFKCNACPAGTLSPAGSTDLSQCKCPAGRYATETNLFNITCIECPSSSSSAEGSTSIDDCICPPGLGVAAHSYTRQITSTHDVCDSEIRSYSPIQFLLSNPFLGCCCIFRYHDPVTSLIMSRGSSWTLGVEGSHCDHSCAQIGLVCKSDAFDSGMLQSTLEVINPGLLTPSCML